MKHAHFKLILAAFSLLGACETASPICLAGEMESGCDCGCRCEVELLCLSLFATGSGQFHRGHDGCTKCAWSREPGAVSNALATPLRQYYIPRPPQCCWYNGWGNYLGQPARGQVGTRLARANCQNQG